MAGSSKSNKRHFLLKSITDQAQIPRQGAGVGTVGAREGRISVPRTCRVRCSPKGSKLGFEYLPTYKTLHCVHGIPRVPQHMYLKMIAMTHSSF